MSSAGETNQWHPELISGNEHIAAPDRDGYHLSEDIVDTACLWLRQLISADPDKPFFLYLAFAAGHSPHHVPREFADKYRGCFDDGWDAARNRILARQRETGLLPPDQQLAPRNPGVQVWDELSTEEKRVASRWSARSLTTVRVPREVPMGHTIISVRAMAFLPVLRTMPADSMTWVGH